MCSGGEFKRFSGGFSSNGGLLQNSLKMLPWRRRGNTKMSVFKNIAGFVRTRPTLFFRLEGNILLLWFSIVSKWINKSWISRRASFPNFSQQTCFVTVRERLGLGIKKQKNAPGYGNVSICKKTTITCLTRPPPHLHPSANMTLRDHKGSCDTLQTNVIHDKNPFPSKP